MFPLSTSFLIMSVKYVTASSVERLDRNPNWKDDSKNYYSRGVTTTVYIQSFQDLKWNPKSAAWNPRIQDWLGLPLMGRHLDQCEITKFLTQYKSLNTFSSVENSLSSI